jgi:hypothetical protein
MTNRQSAFEKIYKDAYWGTKHLSGAGSTLDSTKFVRNIIEKIVVDYQIRTLVDVACGDMVWMPLVVDGIRGRGIELDYLGCDIVDSLIVQHQRTYPNLRFQHLDFVDGEIPKADLIICREALQHLPVRDIISALRNFSSSGAKYLLATIHLRRAGIGNWLSGKTGRCRNRNLLLAPFSLPNPLCIFPEELGEKDKFIALWQLPFSPPSVST